ncbi:hypothetical protein N9N28_00320 [Rubripirellula amarantea]|nr:hypothetical protein [Rubripirellula amarantea]
MESRYVYNWFGLTWLVLVTMGVVADAEDPESHRSGLHHQTGKHLRLTTDVDDRPFIVELVTSFDAAVPLWEKFWNLPTGSLNDWVVDAYVMKDTERFRKEALLDYRVPDFPFGYSIGNDVWVKLQPSQYYTRHLLLHEGVHSLAFDQFGGAGPTWFMEGTADLLSTHRGTGSEISVGVIPDDRDDFAYWGRFKRMKQLRQASRIPALETVMKYEANLKGDVEAYGWSWALASMLHAYPEYRDVFLEAAHHGQDSMADFNRWCYTRLGNDWPVVQARWRNLAQDFDYGFDWTREQIQLSKQDRVWDGKPFETTVVADQGWQSIKVRLNTGMKIQLTASGEVTLDDDPKPWISHPQGVTIKYSSGRPLGQLIARIVPNRSDKNDYLPPLETIKVGNESTLIIEQPCWLLLRVNDGPEDLADNQGSYRVSISRL